jgi:hypothetical protein
MRKLVTPFLIVADTPIPGFWPDMKKPGFYRVL